MFNLNGVWVDADDVQSILPNGPEVHISLANGATYNLPGEPGVDIAVTAAKMADAVNMARISGNALPAVPLPSMTPQSFIDGVNQDQSRVTPLGVGEEQEIPDSFGANQDELNAKWYSDGWYSGLKEARLQMLNGTFDMFIESQLNEIFRNQQENEFMEAKRKMQSEDDATPEYEPHLFDFPAEDDTEPNPMDGWAAKNFSDAFIQRADGSGEPEEEANMNKTRPINEGKVTLEYEEWQGGLDEAYARGTKDGLTGTRQVTLRSLQKMTSEILVDAGGSPPNNLTFLRSALPRLGWTVVE